MGGVVGFRSGCMCTWVCCTFGRHQLDLFVVDLHCFNGHVYWNSTQRWGKCIDLTESVNHNKLLISTCLFKSLCSY